MVPLINPSDDQCACWPFPEMVGREFPVRTTWIPIRPEEDLDAESESPPQADRRSTPVRTRGRQRLHRTVLDRMSTVPGPRRRLGRAVAVPVLRLGRLLGRLAEPARPSPLRGDRPPRRRPAAPRLTPALVLCPRPRCLNLAGTMLMCRTPVVVAGMSRARP